MFTKTSIIALAAATAAQAATPQGFNYGSKMGDTPRDYNSFKTDFENQQKLQGAPGTFNAARLYTMLDAKDGVSPIPALQAAIDTKTYLLLGLWMSGKKEGYEAEMAAFNTTVENMPELAQYVVGISVGSEDLYRISPTGLAAPDAAPGNGPDTIVQYINQVKGKIATKQDWAKIPVGHVDTWTAWVNGSNSAVIDAADFLGVDAYPYWQLTQANAVSNGKSLFDEAMDNTKGVANGKDVWITETGWAVSGPTEGQAEPGIAQAQQYWDEVGCPNFGNTPTFWYTLYDGVANMSGPNTTPSFSVADDQYKPLFDLSCNGVVSNTTSSSSSSSPTGTASGSSSSGSAANGTYTGSPSQPSSTGSSGSGSSSSGSTGGSSTSGSASGGSGSASSSSSAHSSTASISTTNGASSLSYSFGGMIAVAAAVAAFL